MTVEEYLGRSRVLRRLRAGPFKECVDLYFDRFQAVGYSHTSAISSITLFASFFGWLADHSAEPADINEPLVKRYVDWRQRKQRLRTGDRSKLRLLITVLRAAQIVSPAVPAALGPVDQLLERYRAYLEQRRGLKAASAAGYVWFNRRYLREIAFSGLDDLARLTEVDVIGYVERHVHDGSADTAKNLCARLRSLLRYFQLEGYVTHDLAACIPLVKRWRQATLPTWLSAEQLQQVFQSCDRSTAVGRRDYAVLMMLARLGLRANEVATLTLDDIDWRSSQFHIQAKGRQRATMPLPFEVGDALVDYLRNGRPASDSRRVFLRACAPYASFPTARGISDIARRALMRAEISGLARRGSHVLRHSLATELLRSGATLTQIGQVLRHQDPDTTRIYAKVDLASLRPLALPWPGAEQ